jgi:hypothetical protein
VPIGKALVAAKRAYMAETPYLRGIDEKSLLEATLFGLPMLGIDMPGERITPTPQGSLVTTLSDYPSSPDPNVCLSPGDCLGLQYADITTIGGNANPRTAEVSSWL